MTAPIRAIDVAANINARIEAQGVIDLCGEQSQRFWEVLAELVESKLPAKPVQWSVLSPMEEREAICFEAQLMPYGQAEGTLIGTVDCDYLAWLIDNHFCRELRRYLKSDRFKRRQESECSE